MRRLVRPKGFRILLYIGIERPLVRTDYAEVLVAELLRAGHDIAGAVVRSTDRLIPYLRSRRIPVLTLPEELAGTAPEIKRSLAEDDAFRRYFSLWIEHLKELSPGLGITSWGSWIPSEVFKIPSIGFLNYHPAPLPDLRGMEPDTFAILEGRTCVHGTIHELSHGFDTGRIVARTRKVQLRKYDTPVSLLDRLNREGIKTLCRIIPAYATGRLTPEEQGECSGLPATLKRARNESTIQWETDDAAALDRKLRAFCGQDIGIRLKAVINDATYNITDIECWDGDFPGAPGTLIGYYRGKGPFHDKPIVRIRDGAAVLRTMGRIEALPFSSIYYPECMMLEQIPPRRRSRRTTRRDVDESIEVFKAALSAPMRGR